MITLVGVVIVSGLFFVFGTKVLKNKHELKVIEAKKQSQLAIDAQRYEKIREIMADSIVDGQPAALEVLKPLVEVIAAQMQGEEALELKKLEHKQQLALIEAQNEPFRAWMQKLKELNSSVSSNSGYEKCVNVAAEATKKIFGDSFQQALPAPGKKALPES